MKGNLPSRQRLWIWPMLMGWALLPGCHKSSLTGRTQYLLTTEAQENQLGLQAYQEVLAKSKVSTDQEMTAVVRRVGERIARVADRPDYDWEFNLIESNQVNAFCLPGGKIAVYTGILPILQNEAGLAAVMGHEVAHALLRHGGERLSQNVTAAVIQEVLKIGVRGADPAMQDTVLKVYGVGSQVGVLLPFSREHEREADRIGLELAAEAGYDPEEAIAVWERMQARGAEKPPEFLSTHPSEASRIREMKKMMPAAQKAYNKAPEQYGLGVRWGDRLVK